jgi:hypothetical protein
MYLENEQGVELVRLAVLEGILGQAAETQS